MKVAVIGTTTWGTTLGIMLARRRIEVSLWARTKEEAEKLDKARENSARLPGVAFPPDLSTTSSVAEAVRGASLVIVAVPQTLQRAPEGLVVRGVRGDERAVAKGLCRVAEMVVLAGRDDAGRPT